MRRWQVLGQIACNLEIDGYFVSGYSDNGDAPDKELSLVPGSTADAEKFLRDHPATQARFGRVAELVDGFETPFGLELLSTVHWVCTREQATDASEVVSKVYSWNERKRQFSPRQILLARRERLDFCVHNSSTSSMNVSP